MFINASYHPTNISQSGYHPDPDLFSVVWLLKDSFRDFDSRFLFQVVISFVLGFKLKDHEPAYLTCSEKDGLNDRLDGYFG
jgi:hypothetical protein